ncbi:MAG: ABC transporter ATP-binding protein [Bacteroidales bacterium]|nr:ABC transporter ATP-binding protein [Bacteroidales bacterium]
MSICLELENAQVGYTNGFTVSGISFGAKFGTITGIIGPNGSGKSTLFKGICADLPLQQGAILLDNKHLEKLSLLEKAQKMAVVTQFTDKYAISVEEYVMLGRTPYRKPFQMFETATDRHIVEHYMKLTDVFRLRHKQMLQLSGGEQQLASIARALAQEPQLLLLDEPTAHLDISHQVQILDLVQHLSNKLNIAVLLIIHDLNLASEYCDFLVMMNEGCVFVKGSPEEVLNYKNIETVYKTLVVVEPNPLSKKPAVFLVSEKMKRQIDK